MEKTNTTIPDQKHYKITSYVAIGLFAAALFSFSITLIFVESNFVELQGRINASITKLLLNESLRVKEILEEQLVGKATEVEHLSDLIGIYSENPEKILDMIKDYFEEEVREGEFVLGISYTDNEGKNIYYFPEELSKSSIPQTWWDEFISYTKEVHSATLHRPLFTPETGYVFSLSVPVHRSRQDHRSGESLGILTVIFPAGRTFGKSLKDLHEFFLVDSYGRIIFFDTIDTSMKKSIQLPVVGNIINPQEVTEKESFSLIAHKVLAGEHGVGEFHVEHMNHIAGFAPVFFSSGLVDNRSSDYAPSPKLFMGFGFYIHESEIKQHAEIAQTTIILLFVIMAVILVSLGVVGFFVMKHVQGETTRANQVKLKSIQSAAGGAAHSISQPLTGIFGSIAILQASAQHNPEELPEKVSDIVEKMQSAAERIANIVDGMKDIVKLQEEDYLGKQHIVVYEDTDEKADIDEQV